MRIAAQGAVHAPSGENPDENANEMYNLPRPAGEVRARPGPTRSGRTSCRHARIEDLRIVPATSSRRKTPTAPIATAPAANSSIEAALQARGFLRIAGVDEVGRGPLAGPVVAAAVVLDPGHVPDGLADSKLLTPARREALFERIVTGAEAVATGAASAEEIDRINIRQATFLAMRRAIMALALPADIALIDGRDTPPGLPCPAQAIVKGDRLSVSIAAASIVAKVVRDRLMTRLADACPGYGFERHAGYPTSAHRKALERIGPSRFHRLTFAPLSGAQRR